MKLTFRNIFASCISAYLLASGKVETAIKGAFEGKYILSVYFHNPSKREFESTIKWLLKQKLQFISSSDLWNIANNNVVFPKGAVLITVDDGWASNKTNIVDIAERYKIPVTIFISSEPVEKGRYWWSYAKKAIKSGLLSSSVEDLKRIPNGERLKIIKRLQDEVKLEREALTPTQVQEISMSKYITIGGHTHTHTILPQCTDDTVREELQLSKEKLEAWTGKEVKFFAYPNGDFTPREISTLKDLDYKLSFANNPQYLTPETLRQSPYSIPRFGFL